MEKVGERGGWLPNPHPPVDLYRPKPRSPGRTYRKSSLFTYLRGEFPGSPVFHIDWLVRNGDDRFIRTRSGSLAVEIDAFGDDWLELLTAGFKLTGDQDERYFAPVDGVVGWYRGRGRPGDDLIAQLLDDVRRKFEAGEFNVLAS